MQQMEAELTANATLKINLHLLTEIKRFRHFVFNTAFKNDVLLQVVVHDS